MPEFSKEETEARKKAVFESMSARRRNQILNKLGYEKWDPFQAPKDPIDMRRDTSKRTTQMLVRDFLHTRTLSSYSNSYGAGALDICLGLMNDDDRYRGMYDFACWYRDQLDQQKKKTDDSTR